jgi:ketosteroid isomerase-like protein
MPFEYRKWAAMIDDDLVLRAKAFVNSVEAGAPAASIEAFYHPDIVQEEYPNLLLPNGAVRRFDDLRAANEKARSLLRSQRFEIVNAVRSGDHVALESLWTGTFNVTIGNLAPGAPMRARFAQFFEFRDGLIWRLRNYDCFEPF